MSWRSEGIKYRKNEVFLDVIESVNLLVGFLFFFKKCVFFVIGNKANLTFKISKALRNSFCVIVDQRDSLGTHCNTSLFYLH